MTKTKLKSQLLLLATIGVMMFSSCQKEDSKENLALKQNDFIISEQFACSIAENIAIPREYQPANFSPSKSKASRSKKVKKILAVPTDTKENACFIVNYEGGGFAVLSADKRLIPILSFSETSEFPVDAELTPDGVVEWLYRVKENVEEVRKKGEIPNEVLKKEWDNLLPTMVIDPPDPNFCENEFEQIGPLLSTRWHQRCGFNDLLPTAGEIGCSIPDLPCGKAFAGCVPIAIAQVMRYHQYPNNFNWSAMPNSVTPEGAGEVARLVKAIHKVVPVEYHCNRTSVSTDFNVATTFTSSFGYTSASKADYSFLTVESNLRKRQPVILSGGRNGGWWIFPKYVDGHMWVCDGFRKHKSCMFDNYGNFVTAIEYLYLSMNWGWNGAANGWYAFNNFNPTLNGTTYTFNFRTKMVYNIKP